jgi:LPXTG-site transpeptidase (sortase) family protein
MSRLISFRRFSIASGNPNKDSQKKLKNFLITLGVFLILTIFFSCFYFVKNIEKITKFPNFVIKKQEEKKEKYSYIKDFSIKIDKIDVLVPIIANVNGVNKNTYNKELQKGVVHLKGTALPGEGSNIFIFGHSSSEIGWGKYAKIFSKLNELKRGDKIIVFYNKEKFIYSVFNKEIVKKDEINVINPTKKEQLTLMTCWPVGTAKERLIIKSHLLE